MSEHKERGSWVSQSPPKGPDLSYQPQVLPLPAILSSCHQAILRGQLGISLAPRSVPVSADLPGTHTASSSSAMPGPTPWPEGR